MQQHTQLYLPVDIFCCINIARNKGQLRDRTGETMRRIYIAAVAASLAWVAPAHASLSIYGSIAGSFAHVNSSQAAGDRNASTTEQGARFGSQVQDGQSFDNNATFFGLTGNLDGVSFRFESSADLDKTNGAANGLAATRNAYIQFEGRGGTLRIGRTRSAYARTLVQVDAFYDTSSTNFVGGFSGEGATYGMSNLANGWTDNALDYVSPKWHGLALHAAGYAQELNDEDHDYYLGLSFGSDHTTFQAGHAFIGAQNADAVIAGAETVADSATHATLLLEWDSVKVGASYEFLKLRAIADDRQYAQLSVSLYPNRKLSFDIAGGVVSQGPGEGIGGSVGIRGKIGPLASWRLLHSYSDLENDAESQITSFQFKINFDVDVGELADKLTKDKPTRDPSN